MSEEELEYAIKLASNVCRNIFITNQYFCTIFNFYQDPPTIESINAMKKLLLWPKGKESHVFIHLRVVHYIIFFSTENLFPVLDILRLGVCEANISSQIITPDVLKLIIQNIDVPPANQLMSIRILSNMLAHGYGRGLIETCMQNILVTISTIRKGSANLQIAIATLLLNLSIVQTNYADPTQCQLITESLIDFLLWNADSEALYRCYRSIGNGPFY